MPSGRRPTIDQTKLREHPLVAKLVPQPDSPDAIRIEGYIGRSPKKGFIRLYRSLAALYEYVEFPVADVRHVEPAPKDVLEHGGTYIWVKTMPVIRYLRSANIHARYLSGSISSKRMSQKEDKPHDTRPGWTDEPCHSDTPQCAEMLRTDPICATNIPTIAIMCTPACQPLPTVPLPACTWLCTFWPTDPTYVTVCTPAALFCTPDCTPPPMACTAQCTPVNLCTVGLTCQKPAPAKPKKPRKKTPKPPKPSKPAPTG